MSEEPYPRWFWLYVIIGIVIVWGLEALVVPTIPGHLRTAVWLVVVALLAVGGLGLLRRAGHGLAPSLSVVLPLSALLAATSLLHLGGVLGVAIYVAAVGLFLAFALGERFTGWWYRVMLRSRWQPPEPSNKERLRLAYLDVIDRSWRGGWTEGEFARLRDDIVRLDRFRTDETRAFIDVAQAHLLDWTDRRDVPKDEADHRESQILELGDQLWLQDGPRANDSGGKHRRSLNP